jgi:hypothetical protein
MAENWNCMTIFDVHLPVSNFKKKKSVKLFMDIKRIRLWTYVN